MLLKSKTTASRICTALLSLALSVLMLFALLPFSAAAAESKQTFRTNHTNSNHYATGDCNIFFPNHGSYAKSLYDFAWWNALVFCWDAETDCYVCVQTDFANANGAGKYPVIPKNGFVIMDCYSDASSAVSTCSVGTKAWLYPDGSNYLISLNQPESGRTQYIIPTVSDKQLASPTFTNLSSDSHSAQCTESGFTLQWNAVPGATSYTLAINTAMPNALHDFLVQPIEITGTSYTIPAGKLRIGYSYTISLYANGGSSIGSSKLTVGTIYCVSELAKNSSLAGKTIVAFGDSLTARTGWVSMLSGEIGVNVINAGVGGDSTYNASLRFESDVLSQNPDIVLMCFGMNDQAQQLIQKTPIIPLKNYIANLTRFITELQAKGTDVILICPHDPYKDKNYYQPGGYNLDYAYGNMPAYCNAIRQLAVQYHCGLIDIHAEAKSEDMTKFLNAGDGIHQSTYGHQRWADYISAYLFAKYDHHQEATITVTCKDSSGVILKTYRLTAAIGAKLQLPAPEFDGMTFSGKETILTVTGSTEMVYSYRSTTQRLLGDLNGNGKLDAMDYILLKRSVLGITALSDAQQAVADLTQDGEVNFRDYLALKRQILIGI